MKPYYQIVYKEPGRIDGAFNTVGSQTIFADINDAWLDVMSDCENDGDIAYLMERVSKGEITIKTLQAKEI